MTLKTLAKPPAAEQDQSLAEIASVIDKYLVEHPTAKFDLYRQSRFNVRLRIIDQDFKGMFTGDRHRLIWNHLHQLTPETSGLVTFMALLTPDEIENSHINYEYENPSWIDSEGEDE